MTINDLVDGEKKDKIISENCNPKTNIKVTGEHGETATIVVRRIIELNIKRKKLLDELLIINE